MILCIVTLGFFCQFNLSKYLIHTWNGIAVITYLRKNAITKAFKLCADIHYQSSPDLTYQSSLQNEEISLQIL